MMLRNIHFFNIKPGADEVRILHLWDHEIAEYAKTFGCIERKTLKLLDASSEEASMQAAAYINESLWPSRKEADAFAHAVWPTEVRIALDELFSGIENHIIKRGSPCKIKFALA